MNRTRTASTALVFAGAAVVALTATRDLVYNPTPLRVKPVVSEFTRPLVGLAVTVAIAWVLLSDRRIRGGLAVGGGLVVAVQLARWTVFDPTRYVEPTAMAWLAIGGGLAIVAGGAVTLLGPRVAPEGSGPDDAPG